MNFPSSLIQNDRPKLPSRKIFLRHLLYARHKEGPGGTWDSVNNIPDFTQIKIPKSFDDSSAGKGQSFNWCIFSLPVWTRFNNDRDYLENSAVVAYSVRSIRRTKEVLLRNSDSGIVVENGSLDVEHSPNPNNYSHCHLSLRVLLSHAERREARMAIKHNSYVSLRPNQQRLFLLMWWDYVVMYLNRVISQVEAFVSLFKRADEGARRED